MGPEGNPECEPKPSDDDRGRAEEWAALVGQAVNPVKAPERLRNAIRLALMAEVQRVITKRLRGA